MKKYFLLAVLTALTVMAAHSQNLRISDPESSISGRLFSSFPRPTFSGRTDLVPADFKFDAQGNFVSVGNYIGASKPPVSGAGTRMMWFPNRGSFRFGTVFSNEWDSLNLDDYTFAGGNNVIANNYGAFAFGDQVKVTSVLGVGFGSAITVNGTAAFAVGASCTANGFAGVSLGYTNRANGQGCVAIGYRCSAPNDFCVALGYRASSASFTGCMVMGDESATDSVLNTTNNQFAARYSGGYRFYSNATKTLGVSLAASGTAWASISDSTKKENFVQADANNFLDKLSKLKLGS